MRVYDAGVLPSGERFFVMDRLEGRTLAEEIENHSPSIESIASWMLDIIDALEEAHVLGLVHRDVKPANIFIADSDRRARLLDFGIARDASQAALTGTREVIGTAHFMAPEQLLTNREVDARADIFAVGAVLYAALAGAFPWNATSLVGLAKAMRTKPPIDLATVKPGLPPKLVATVMRAIDPDPALRFPTARELGEALAGLAPSRRPISSMRRRESTRSVGVYAALGTIALGAIAIAVVLLFIVTPPMHRLTRPRTIVIDASVPIAPVASDEPEPLPSASAVPRRVWRLGVVNAGCSLDSSGCRGERVWIERNMQPCAPNLPTCPVFVTYSWNDNRSPTDIFIATQGDCVMQSAEGIACIKRVLSTHRVAKPLDQEAPDRSIGFGLSRAER